MLHYTGLKETFVRTQNRPLITLNNRQSLRHLMKWSKGSRLSFEVLPFKIKVDMIRLTALQKRYHVAMKDFFDGKQEKARFELSNIGKELVLAKMGPEVLLEMHSLCLKEIVERPDPITIGRMVANANEVLVNGIMAYAMNYYSFTELLENEKQKLEVVRAELQKKAANLEEANVELKEVDHLKSLFIASMSHELRTPLNSVIGFSSILLNEWVGPLNDEQKENLLIVLKAGKHLLGLINDIIDLSKMEAGKIDVFPEEFDVAELVKEGAAALEKDAEKKGLYMKVEADHVIMRSDRRRLLQCLLNVISNAVKFTEHGGIKISARLVDRSQVVISVKDTGIGIAQHEQEKLFAPFSCPPSAERRKVQGAGLGLYLTKRLVTEALKGEIMFSSMPGEGSTFTFRLPVWLNGNSNEQPYSGFQEKL